MRTRFSAVAFMIGFLLGMLALGCGDATGPSQAARESGFRVTAVTVVAPVPAAFTGACPVKVVFAGHVTTDGPGTIRFVWVRSDGGTSAENTETFNTAGTHEIVTSWTLGDHRERVTAWQSLRVTSPNLMESSHADFALSCL
jgi:hypothetical protein